MSESKPKRRPRISLLSLLLLMALAATSLTTTMLWREVGPLRSEVRRLRFETGALRVGDPKLIHAIGVETYVTQAWKWRVWVPAGRRLAIQVAVEEVPMPGAPELALPRVAGRLTLNEPYSSGREIEATLSAEKRLDGSVRWIIHQELTDGSVSTYVVVPADSDEWLQTGHSGSKGGGRVKMEVVERPGEPLVLLHKRVFYQSGQIPPRNAAATGDGIMAWIEEVKE